MALILCAYVWHQMRFVPRPGQSLSACCCSGAASRSWGAVATRAAMSGNFSRGLSSSTASPGTMLEVNVAFARDHPASDSASSRKPMQARTRMRSTVQTTSHLDVLRSPEPKQQSCVNERSDTHTHTVRQSIVTPPSGHPQTIPRALLTPRG